MLKYNVFSWHSELYCSTFYCVYLIQISQIILLFPPSSLNSCPGQLSWSPPIFVLRPADPNISWYLFSFYPREIAAQQTKKQIQQNSALNMIPYTQKLKYKVILNCDQINWNLYWLEQISSHIGIELIFWSYSTLQIYFDSVKGIILNIIFQRILFSIVTIQIQSDK